MNDSIQRAGRAVHVSVHDSGQGRTSARLEVRQRPGLSVLQGFQVLCDTSAVN